MAANNPCAKTVTLENAYEVWQSYDGSWTYFVLKKYQTPEKEAQNPYARWYCDVSSPLTQGRLDYGDTYVRTVKDGTDRVLNPLRDKDDNLVAFCHDLDEVPLNNYVAIE